MKKSTRIIQVVLTLTASFIFYSCQKSEQKIFREEPATTAEVTNLVTPYLFERINENNFSSQGWREQQINDNTVTGGMVFQNSSDHMEIVCGPVNNSDPRLIQGAVTMNLPTSTDPSLRRIRLRKEGYSGTRLADLEELKYSTYVVQKAPTVLVFQVDIDGDNDIDYNFFYDPRPISQGAAATPVVNNTWQQWNALDGIWEIFSGSIPEFPQKKFTLQQLCRYPQYANARILDTIPDRHKGEGIRFTIGGGADYENAIGYFDAFIIKTKNQQVARLYDFACNNPVQK